MNEDFIHVPIKEDDAEKIVSTTEDSAVMNDVVVQHEPIYEQRDVVNDDAEQPNEYNNSETNDDDSSVPPLVPRQQAKDSDSDSVPSLATMLSDSDSECGNPQYQGGL